MSESIYIYYIHGDIRRQRIGEHFKKSYRKYIFQNICCSKWPRWTPWNFLSIHIYNHLTNMHFVLKWATVGRLCELIPHISMLMSLSHLTASFISRTFTNFPTASHCLVHHFHYSMQCRGLDVMFLSSWLNISHRLVYMIVLFFVSLKSQRISF